MNIKNSLKKYLPLTIKNKIIRYRQKKNLKEYSGLSEKEIFKIIYEKSHWGNSLDVERPFFSGSGSEVNLVVNQYVDSVSHFLSEFSEKPNVVDLGCGDFYVGSQIRSKCSGYIACDIVPELIEYNKWKYKNLDVDFREVNICEDKLPTGEVVFVREVFQHLSNEAIARVIPELIRCYKYIVFTEHLPINPNFPPNINKPTGPDIRLSFGSGIDLTKKPFNIKIKTQKVLCEAFDRDGIIKTILFATY